MQFFTSDYSLVSEQFSDAFVDDTQNGLNDAHTCNPWSLPKLLSNLAKLAQTWERMLHVSGGALELSNVSLTFQCSYYVLYWQWKNGLPVLTPKSEFPPGSEISLT